MSENEAPVETPKKSAKQIALSLIKIIIYTSVIFGLIVFVILNYTSNESEIYFVFLLLGNGLLKDFCTGIKSVFTDKKNTISEFHKLENAVSTVRYIVLCNYY